MPRPLDAEGRAAVDALLSLAERGFPQGARKTRARTARLDGAVEAMGAVLAWAGGNRERLAAALGALEPLPGGPWDWIAELAEELILDGRIDEAAAITYSVASPLEDECLSGDFALALASFGPRERAVAAIETCLKHFPHGPLAALTCAEAWLELEEPARAEPLLRRVLDLSTRGVLRDDPELAEDLRRDSLSILLPLLLGEGREDEARTVYRRHAGSPVLRRSAIVVPIDAPRTGRNEPCPCGSGRKFKHCCGSLAAPATAPNVSELIGTVSAFGRLAALPEFGDDARQAYFGEGPPMLGDDSEVAAFIEWRTLDLPDATGRTALRRFAEWYADELDGPTCALLDALDRSQVRLYEVCAIRPGEGFTLLDLLDGRTAEIRERPGSRQVQPWDLLAARLFERNGAIEMAGGVLAFPALEKAALLAALREALDRVGAERPELTEADRVKLAAPAFQRHRAAMRDRPLPRLSNQDGEPIVFSTARYEVRDVDEVRHQLSGARAFCGDERGRNYDWIAAKPSGVILGHLVLTPRRLRLETNSRERLTRGRARLERLLGDLVWHRGDSFESVEDAIRKRGRRSGADVPGPGRLPPEMEQQALAQVLDAHYRRWPDEPLPALDGRTPRQAAADPALRPRLVDLLRFMENAESRGRAPGARYDFGWIWKELGVPRGE